LSIKKQYKSRISIITVVLNSEQLIERTLCSVLNQTYNNFEHIVIDGASSDNTINLIKKYSRKNFFFISEPDYGIYDAMNKAIEYVTGDWIIFLNAGDVFISNETLTEVSPYLVENIGSAVLYGDVLVDYNYFTKYVKSRPIGNIENHMVTNHQACFIRSSVHKVIKYDLKYKIASDYDFVLKLFKKGYEITQLNNIVSKVQAGGISDTRRDKTFSEYLNIKNKYNIKFNNYIHYFRSIFYYRISYFVKLILPRGVKDFIYSYKHKV
jgi:glycosyltransferase involved in cell wall biosynthesis